VSHLYSNSGVNTDKKTSQVLSLMGSRIRKLRKEKGWTQETLAENADINDKEVSHIELGNRNVTIETLIKISECLDTLPSIILAEPN
jgi:transcriptional regulator with XRE-family HTH domain